MEKMIPSFWITNRIWTLCGSCSKILYAFVNYLGKINVWKKQSDLSKDYRKICSTLLTHIQNCYFCMLLNCRAVLEGLEIKAAGYVLPAQSKTLQRQNRKRENKLVFSLTEKTFLSSHWVISATGAFKQLFISLLLGGCNKKRNKQTQHKHISGLINSQNRSHAFNGGSNFCAGI